MSQNKVIGLSRQARSSVTSDFFGGLSAMLVALPSAIAFGLLVFAPLGADAAGHGAMAGIMGTIALGLIAPVFGGAPRLISAPCAPAAAVLATLVAEGIRSGGVITAESIPIVLVIVTFLTGVLQLTFGAVGGGRLIKYVPYPVVDGYLSGVGVLILLSQLPKLLGLPKGIKLWQGLMVPSVWVWPGLMVGLVTIAVMLIAPRIIKAVPASVIALSAGCASYFALAIFHPEMATLAGNHMVIGPIDASSGGGGFLSALMARWSSVGALGWAFTSQGITLLLVPAITLSVLLSIDTLKTCVIVDALTRSRHNSNRELIGQGLGNFASALVGGLPGAGTMGATLMNLNSGGKTRLSGVFAGVSALLALLLLSGLVAWVPFAALAGILTVVAFRMIDWKSVALLRQKSTAFDFVVVLAVVVSAIAFNLIAAAGVGVALAIFLFLREQIRTSVVRRRSFGNQMFSKKRRLPDEMAVLGAHGSQTVIFELHGSLFFGTTDQLFSEVEPYLSKSKYMILDMRRVRSLDFTAAHLLEQIEVRITEHGGFLIFSNLSARLPNGRRLQEYLSEVGLVRDGKNVKAFSELGLALEWVEDQILEANLHGASEDNDTLAIDSFNLFTGLSQESLAAVSSCAKERSYEVGQKVFCQGDKGDELFLVRRGSVRIMLPLGPDKSIHLATISKGDFFGDMAFLDKGIRSADIVVSEPTDLYILSRAQFDKVAIEQRGLGRTVFSRLAHVLAVRLRQTDTELRALEEG